MPRCDLLPISSNMFQLQCKYVQIVSQNFTKFHKYGVFLKHVSTSWQLVASTKAPTLPPTMWPSSDLAVQRLIDSGYLRTFRTVRHKGQRTALRSLPKVLSRCVILGCRTAGHMTHTVHHTTYRVRHWQLLSLLRARSYADVA